MTIEIIRDTFLWCTLINWGMLLFWFLILTFARSWAYKMHSKFAKITEEEFNLVHYKGGVYFKVLIFAFNLAPYLALCIVTS